MMEPSEYPTSPQSSKRKKKTFVKSQSENGMKTKGNAIASTEVLSDWKDYFSNRKPLLMVMEHHTFMLIVRNAEVQFKCDCCNVCLKSLLQVNIHIQKEGHLRALRSFWLLHTISVLTPTTQVFEKMTAFLEGVVSMNVCDTKFLQSRTSIFQEISAIIQRAWTDCDVHMIGSSYHGLGLNSAGLDISMATYAKDEPLSVLIRKLMSFMESHPNEFQQIEKSFYSKPPIVKFMWKKQLPCKIIIDEDKSRDLAELVQGYGTLDDRCKKLVVLFRKWGSVCLVDEREYGWPPHAFCLLVIYFLQQVSPPVLPVINEIAPPKSKASMDQSFKIVKSSWQSKNMSNLAVLWVQLLKFYSYQFDSANRVVCITQSAPMLREKTGIPGKKLALLDPYSPKTNLLNIKAPTSDYILRCLRLTCGYFCIPQFEQGPIFGLVQPSPDLDPESDLFRCFNFVDEQLTLTSYIVQLIPHMDSNYVVDKNETTAILEKIIDLKGVFVNVCSFEMSDFDQLFERTFPIQNKYKKYNLFLKDAQMLMEKVNCDLLSYQFSRRAFFGGQDYGRICEICHRKNHTAMSCPDMVLEKLADLPPIDDELERLIDAVCLEVFKASNPSRKSLSEKESVVDWLTKCIQEVFPDARLTLFGSSKNGFGLENSDMDVCLTFEGNRNLVPTRISSRKVLRRLFYHFSRFRELKNKNLIFIRGAKVPIVKFLHSPSMLEGDISFYNVLALENTQLLRTYSKIDDRVQKLGYMIKRLAKICEVGDASKGSLSSYCYILMMLYFLQRCDPPVLPVLQSLPNTNQPLPKKIIDEHNAYFFQDIDRLKEVWDGYGRNKKSAGKLWIEFLRFYTEEFDMLNYVVSIRSELDLLKLDKGWVTKVFAIEDPFIWEHNLGSGLTPKMNLFIIKAFRSARALFTTKLKAVGRKSLTDGYFDEKILRKTSPPNERGCRICRCIGHATSVCPQSEKQGEKTVSKAERRRPLPARGQVPRTD